MSSIDDVTRRDVLKASGAAVTAVGVAGIAGAADRVEVTVGYAGPQGRRAALDAASAVVREFEFPALTVLADDRAVGNLRDRGDVRYVEPTGAVPASARSPR